jgi:2-methylisocitrate lyase-like PEP mutase family enzyme
MSPTQAQQATRLLELHHAATPVILINAWDAASAAMIAHCGLPAVASSSAALANAMGFPDGQHLPWPQMLDAVKRIVQAVNVPVTADIESGFAANSQELEATIAQIIGVGAVGVNLEDAQPGQDARGPLFPLAEQIERIKTTRRAAAAQKIHLVINARTDAYWQAGISPEEALRNTLKRGKAYMAAGADCIFVPGLRNPEHIKSLIDHLRTIHPDMNPHANPHAVNSHTPVNILAGPDVPSIPELTRLGVKRVSYGSGPHRAAMGLLRRMATEASSAGTYTALTEGAVPYAEINGLFRK